MVGKGKRIGDVQHLLFGIYLSDPSLESGLSSQRREIGPHVPFRAPSIRFCSELLRAAIRSSFEIVFQKLTFIHHLSC